MYTCTFFYVFVVVFTFRCQKHGGVPFYVVVVFWRLNHGGSTFFLCVALFGACSTEVVARCFFFASSRFVALRLEVYSCLFSGGYSPCIALRCVVIINSTSPQLLAIYERDKN